jgi:hypothetical protein
MRQRQSKANRGSTLPQAATPRGCAGKFSPPAPAVAMARSRRLALSMRYFVNLSAGRLILWCYLIWYLFFTARYFDPTPALWLTSAGLSAIIGVALLISTWHPGAHLASWTTFRLFLMPFCVSSFAALVKGRGFVLVFSPSRWENILALGLCGVFCAVVGLMKLARRSRTNAAPAPGTAP